MDLVVNLKVLQAEGQPGFDQFVKWVGYPQAFFGAGQPHLTHLTCLTVVFPPFSVASNHVLDKLIL